MKILIVAMKYFVAL